MCELSYSNVNVVGKRKGILWFKKIQFEVTYDYDPNITMYYYSLGDLTSALIKGKVVPGDIWLILNALEHRFYKVK